MILKGQRIQFKPEWQTIGDDGIVFIAANDEVDGRIAIVTLGGIPVNLGQSIAVDKIEQRP